MIYVHISLRKMEKVKITLSPGAKEYWINNDHRFSMQSLEKFVSYFFDDINIIIIQNDKIDGVDGVGVDGVIYDIQDNETSLKKINIMICVENCMCFHHYKHFNKFNLYDNPDIKIFLYNFIDKIETNFSSKRGPYIAIPIIYPQMNYFQKQYNRIQPQEYTKFENKKKCLIATNLNSPHKYKIYEMLQSIVQCDFISNYHESIGKKSVYHSSELLNLFNQYLFVFVCENSIADGYVTEKIFNCFFSRTVPIYYGSEHITHYFNEDTFINIPPITSRDGMDLSKTIDTITSILNNKEIYENYIKKDVTDIICKNYDDENYKEQFNLFISQY